MLLFSGSHPGQPLLIPVCLTLCSQPLGSLKKLWDPPPTHTHTSDSRKNRPALVPLLSKCIAVPCRQTSSPSSRPCVEQRNPCPPAPGLGNSDSSANPHSVVSCLAGLLFVRPWFPGSVSRDGTGILVMRVLSVCEQIFPRCTVRIPRQAVVHMPQTLTENDLTCLSG